MVTYSKSEMKEGIACAARMRERFLVDPPDDQARMVATSLMGDSVFSRIREEHIHAVIIYRRPAGWYADIVFQDVPAGVPNVIGTPTSEPLGSRAEAEDSAWLQFSSLVLQARENATKAPPEDLRHFDLHGNIFTIPGGIVDMAVMSGMLLSDEQRGTPEDAHQRLAEHLRAIMGGDGFSIEKWNAAPDDQKRLVFASIIIQLAMGHHRHPPIESAPSPDQVM